MVLISYLLAMLTPQMLFDAISNYKGRTHLLTYGLLPDMPNGAGCSYGTSHERVMSELLMSYELNVMSYEL
jgi:hypothetical protein